MTTLEEEQRRKISKAINEIENAIDFEPHGEATARLAKMIESLKSDREAIIKERPEAFARWVDSIGSSFDALTLDQSINALEFYFEGKPPLKEPKVRKDIPDAFIFAAILRARDEFGGLLSVIVEDAALGVACDGQKIRYFKSLAEFLDSPEAQQFLADAIIDDNLVAVIDKVDVLAGESEDEVLQALEDELLTCQYRCISAEPMPEENEDLYITGVFKPHQVQIDRVEYLGAGVFVAECEAQVELTYEYAVFWSDAFDLDSDKYHIAPLNKHYVTVETTDEFRFSARLEFNFGESILGCGSLDEILASLDSPDICADDLDDFEIVS